MARPDWMTDREVRDATQPVTINIRRKHIEDAVALNGEHCVAGRCTIQALDAAMVWFYRSKAYPEKPNSLIEPGLYALLPPPPAQRLGVNRKARNPDSRPPKADRGHRVMGRVTAARHN